MKSTRYLFAFSRRKEYIIVTFSRHQLFPLLCLCPTKEIFPKGYLDSSISTVMKGSKKMWAGFCKPLCCSEPQTLIAQMTQQNVNLSPNKLPSRWQSLQQDFLHFFQNFPCIKPCTTNSYTLKQRQHSRKSRATWSLQQTLIVENSDVACSAGILFWYVRHCFVRERALLLYLLYLLQNVIQVLKYYALSSGSISSSQELLWVKV